MGRARQFYKYELPNGVIKLVRSYCADFERRKIEIEKNQLEEDILDNYIKINMKISQAFDEIETSCKEYFLDDIVKANGYNKSMVVYISKRAYYNRKRKIIYKIAKGLKLI